MIFESSGAPIPTEEEVQFEAREILQRSGWGVPLIERLHKMSDPYWREAVTRYLMEQWQELVRDRDEQTYYYDSDGDIRYSWLDAEYDFHRIIRRCVSEQVEHEQEMPIAVQPVYCTDGKHTDVSTNSQTASGAGYNLRLPPITLLHIIVA